VSTLIIGGGAAGLMAAACSPGPCVLLERLAAPGRKLLATGGGRCNLTHDTDAAGIAAVFSRNPRFARPALRAFPPERLRAFFRSLGVETLAEPDGCVFPVSQKASDILAALLRAVRDNGAEIRCGVRATRLLLEPDPAAGPGARRVAGVETSHGPLAARRVILAAGGQSYPELGSDGSGFALARDAGLSLVPPVPALAGLITAETWPAALAGLVCERGGLRLDAPDAPKRLLTGPLLFTHRGLSGPPALALAGEVNARLAAAAPQGGAGEVGEVQGSAVGAVSTADCRLPTVPSIPVRVSFIADRAAADWLALFDGWRRAHGGRALHNLLAGELPRALAETLCGLAGASQVAAARAGKAALRALAQACAGQPLRVTGTEGWNRAMVTRGGVALEELDPKTLACCRVRGLHCAGEAVDLDAPCGGYNLTWAFASGRLAALSG
jgi:hypothetical protein